jgi:hypothetical protein
LYSNEAEFIQKLYHEKKKSLAVTFNSIDWLIIVVRPAQEFFHLHVYRDVTIASEGLQTLGLCSALRAFEQGGIFIVPHVLIRSTTPFDRLLRHTRGCEGRILTQILAGSWFDISIYWQRFIFQQQSIPFMCRFDIYPNELENKDTTECSTSASYLDILLILDTNGKITTQVYDKTDDFNFSIVNFPYLCSNISSLTCIWCIYLAADSICKSLFDIW